MLWLLLLLLMLLIPALVAVGVWHDARSTDAPDAPVSPVVGLHEAAEQQAH